MEKIEPRGDLHIMKFGGTSVGSAQAIEGVAGILGKYQDQKLNIIAVVSAMSGVTNRLVELCELIKQRDRKSINRAIRSVLDTHMTTASEIKLASPLRASLHTYLRELFTQLTEESRMSQDMTLAKKDYILSFGERFSARIVRASCVEVGISAEVVDANHIIKTNEDFGQAEPNFEDTSGNAERTLLPLIKKGVMPIVTGFIGSTFDGRITTLGRGGSDYTASILGRVLLAKEVWIWTDVNGIYSDDPKKDPNAQILPEISFTLANQMAKAGAKVLYPKTIEPLMDTETIIWVKNTFNPDYTGTKIVNT